MRRIRSEMNGAGMVGGLGAASTRRYRFHNSTLGLIPGSKANAPKTGRVLERDCLPGNIVTVYPGQYANQAYVDKVLRWYGEYAMEGTTTPETPRVELPTSVTPPAIATPKAVALILGIIGTIFGLGRLRGTK